MAYLITIIVIMFIAVLFFLYLRDKLDGKPYLNPRLSNMGHCIYYLQTETKILEITIIQYVEKHCMNPYASTRNELVLYQLQANMDEQETEAFEKVFAKILKGKD